MTTNTIPDDWTGIPAEVETLIAGRTVRTRGAVLRGKSAVVTDITRPMRFIEFSREVGIDNAQAHRYIRQGVVPEGGARALILSWVKKNRKRAK